MDGHSLTVFKFTPSDTSRVATRSIISLPSPFGFSPALPSTDTVQARNLIASTVGTDGWKSLSVPVPEIVTFGMFASKHHTRCNKFHHGDQTCRIAMSTRKPLRLEILLVRTKPLGKIVVPSRIGEAHPPQMNSWI